MALEITDANYDELVAKSDKLVLLDFWATWCGPCRTIAPIIDELATAYEGSVVIGKVDVDGNTEITSKFGIRNIPTLIFIKNGEQVEKMVGAVQKDAIVAKIEALK